MGNYLLRHMTRVGVEGVVGTAEARAGFAAGEGVEVVVIGGEIVPAAEVLAASVVELLVLGPVISATCDVEALGFFLVMIRDGD
jgi:hypothetical protein